MALPRAGSEGRVAIVTGAGRGVGRAEAHHLAARGYAVVVNDWDDGTSGDATPLADTVVKEIIERGGTAIADYNDVATGTAAKSMVEETVRQFGRIDVLVNNAGIHRSEPFTSMPEHTFDEVLRVCLKGHIEPSRAVATWWLHSDDGRFDKHRRIINTTSLAGIYGSASSTTAYATSKAAIIGLTWSLARELQGLGATVNAIAPRAATRMSAGKPQLRPAGDVDRFAPDRVAPLVGWMAGPASQEFTGRIFVVGGGQVWLIRPFDVFGPHQLLDEADRESLPVDLAQEEIDGSAVPGWTEIEARFA